MSHKAYLKGRKAFDEMHYKQAKKIFYENIVDPLCVYGLYTLTKVGFISLKEECEKINALFKKIFDNILTLAESGDDEATFIVGVCNEKGINVEPNITKAEMYYAKSYFQGNLRAGFNLACCYLERNSYQNILKALNIYENLCGHDIIKAYVNLGCIHLYYPEFFDPDKAIVSLEYAAEHGDALAMYHIGNFYLSEEFGKYDTVKGIHWLTKAISSGNVEALYRLGICYKNGESVENDINSALSLYRQVELKGCFNKK